MIEYDEEIIRRILSKDNSTEMREYLNKFHFLTKEVYEEVTITMDNILEYEPLLPVQKNNLKTSIGVSLFIESFVKSNKKQDYKRKLEQTIKDINRVIDKKMVRKK